LVGGGAQPDLEPDQSRVLEVPYQPLKRSEFGTWGAALIAGHAVGLFSDLAEQASRSAEPNGPPVMSRPDIHRCYEPYVEKYIGWQEVFSHSFRSLAVE
jgi:xylulokinase